MKDQIQFETNGLTVLAVKVPESGVVPLWVERDLLIVQQDHRPEYHDNIKLSGYGYNIHCTTSDMTEEQAKVLVEGKTYNPLRVTFKNYLTGYYCYNAIDSLNTLLCSHGIDPNEKRVLLIK